MRFSVHAVSQEPVIPEHSPVTRRLQFQTKNVLKAAAEAKKQTKQEKAAAKAQAKKDGKDGAKPGKSKPENASPKRKTKKTTSKAKTHRAGEEVVQRGSRTTRGGRVSPRKVKAKRVSRAMKLRKQVEASEAGVSGKRALEGNTLEEPAKRTRAPKSTGDGKGETRRQSTAAPETQKATAKTQAKAKAKSKATPKAKGKAAARRDAAKHEADGQNSPEENEAVLEPGASKRKTEPSRKKQLQEAAQPDPAVTDKILEILDECSKTSCQHSEAVQGLAGNRDQTFQKSIYWSRHAVGLKVPTWILPREMQRSSTLGMQQIAYFSDGPCTYANLFLANSMVCSLLLCV